MQEDICLLYTSKLLQEGGCTFKNGKWYDKDDKALKYTFTIAGDTTDHPAYATLLKAREILNKNGWEVEVIPDARALYKLASLSLIHISFYNCIALKTVTFEGSCVSIGASAFENCRSLSEFTVPEGAELLGARAFANCKNLVTLYVDPESDIQDVGADVFAGSNALKKIEIAGSGSSDRYNTVSYDNGVHKMLSLIHILKIRGEGV